MNRLARHLPALALALTCAGLGGCPDLLDGPGGDDAGPVGPNVDCDLNSAGGCIFSSSACDPEAIVLNVDGTACASCDTDTEVEICGDIVGAPCIELENAFGDACQRCVTLDGTVLFDDCTTSSRRYADDLVCEATWVETDEGDRSMSCEVCRDPRTGQVVSESCRPESDHCEEVVVDGRSCVECTFEGEFAYRECESPELDPTLCTAYGNEAGHCIDCFGPENELLSHQCTFDGSLFGELAGDGDGYVGDPTIDDAYCDGFYTPDGQFCQECYDRNGELVFFSCDEAGPALSARCERLVFTDQTCIVCVDDSGQLSGTTCEANFCEPNGDAAPPFQGYACQADSDCPQGLICLYELGECGTYDDLITPPDPDQCVPPPCDTVVRQGEICRVCPIMSGPLAGQTEELCLDGEGALQCYEEQDYIEYGQPGEGNNGDPGSYVELVTCVVCVDDNEAEVYRQCEGEGGTGGVSSPPVCYDETSPTGDQCAVCYDPYTGEELFRECGYLDCVAEQNANGGLCQTCTDPATGELVYSTCDGTGSLQACTEDQGLALTGQNGQHLTVVIGNLEQEATATCLTCEDTYTATNEVQISSLCALEGVCSDMNAPADVCADGLVALYYDVPRCEPVWGVEYEAGSASEGVGIMSWALETYGVNVYTVYVLPGYEANDCLACGCPRGDVVEIQVSPGDVDTMLNAGFN